MRSRLSDHGSRPIEIVSADGCVMTAADGTRYLDFTAGWCVGNVGWGRREIADAVRAQAERVSYVPPFLRYAGWEEFASLLVERAPGGRVSRAVRCTSGSEAVEMAIKCARAFTAKPTIVSVDHVYHGHTYGAAAVGDACEEAMAPCPPGFLKISLPHPRYGTDAETAVAAFERLTRERDDIAAFLTEPVFTNAGAIVPDAGFLPAIEKICREKGILFVMDEVATGFGRCGRLFASELWGLSPDIVCLGKGLTGGYGTLGATLVTEEVHAASAELPMYSTFGWLPADLAAAKANVDIVLREKLWEKAERAGRRLRERLAPLAELPHVAEVRGIGLLAGIEIVRDERSMAADHRRAYAIQDRCADAGLIVETAGHAIFICPPLVVSDEEIDRGCEVIAAAVAA